MITAVSGGGGFTAQVLEAMRQNRFKKADANGDGVISKDELAAVLPKNGKGPSVDQIFSKFDTNNDGSIDNDEDKAAFQAMGGSHHHHGGPPDAGKLAQNIFAKADTDGDGKISKDELTALLPKDDKNANIDDVFKSIDSDNDGSITQTELTDSLKKAFELMQASNSQGGSKKCEGPQGSFSAMA